MLEKIISGAQTGVDRAALDVAMSLNFEYGGWCPKGRLDERGTIPEKYKNLQEVTGEYKTDEENYEARTKKNIKNSDATLILIPKSQLKITDGTILTIAYAKKQLKQNLIIDLSKSNPANSALIIGWIKENRIDTLNIGGPRESTCPGVYQIALSLLEMTLHKCKPQL